MFLVSCLGKTGPHHSPVMSIRRRCRWRARRTREVSSSKFRRRRGCGRLSSRSKALVAAVGRGRQEEHMPIRIGREPLSSSKRCWRPDASQRRHAPHPRSRIGAEPGEVLRRFSANVVEADDRIRMGVEEVCEPAGTFSRAAGMRSRRPRQVELDPQLLPHCSTRCGGHRIEKRSTSRGRSAPQRQPASTVLPMPASSAIRNHHRKAKGHEQWHG